MKRFIAFFLALFAFVATPALACEFTGQNKDTVGAVISDASVTSVAVGDLAKAFWGDPTKPWPIRSVFERVGCTEADVTAKLIALNGGDSSARLDRAATFIYPTPLPKPASTPTPAPVASAAPAAQASAAPVPAATAPAAAPKPIVAATDMVSDVRKPIQVVRTEIVRIAQKPVSERSPAEVAFLATAPARLDAIEATLRDLPVSGPVPQALTKAQADAINSIGVLQSEQESMKSDISLLKIGLGIVAASLLVLAITLLIGRRRRKLQVERIVNAKLATVKFDDTFKATVLADIAGLQADVTGLKSRFKHDVNRVGETLKPADMKALSDGSEFEYHLLVDGLPVAFDAKVVQHTPSGDALIKIDELPNPVTAKALFVELTDYLERGGALPALKLVNN